ncbi:MAG: crossover junction endodeoxyribonuclease RuvC [Patescibacteria group bacterium]
MLILGIDPGSTRTGYGIIKKDGNNLRLIKSGLLKISSKDKQQRLVELAQSFSGLIKKQKPQLIAIEKLFFMKNIKTALDVAQSRGVLTLIALEHKIPLLEYSPSEIKAAATGYGLADKKAVAKMVAIILKVDKINKIDDVTDALATAITAANNLNKNNFL